MRMFSYRLKKLEIRNNYFLIVIPNWMKEELIWNKEYLPFRIIKSHIFSNIPLNWIACYRFVV